MAPLPTLVFTLVVGVFVSGVAGLDNGLGLTPPMGWMSWQRFRCITDCTLYPDECISEQLFKRIADKMVSEGYKDAGYEYLIIDDCWLSHDRDADGKLQPDPDRFPSGIKALADYIHDAGLKFGLYEDYGNFTCGGYPGVLGNLELDAQTFADWDVDYVKLDGCYADPETMNDGYPAYGTFLNQTGRPMIYSCSWPVYQEEAGIPLNFTLMKEFCNLWRNYDDIDDSWYSVSYIIDYYAQKQDILAQHAGPGHWNDPDMLIIGNYGLTIDQSKAQMAIWAILAAPLIMSNDVATVRPEFKAILLNERVIAVDQDPLGIQGLQILERNNISVWTRAISPIVDGDYSFAVAFLSRRSDGWPYPFAVSLTDIGLTHADGYVFEDLYSADAPFILRPDSTLSVRVIPSGAVFYRATAIQGKNTVLV